MDYEVVIGLEVHAELNTKTKIFCSCKNSFGAEVNTNCCPVCTGMPGTLPVLNQKVVEYAVKMGLACGCSISEISTMDRKNYYYPDLPKAYQITQGSNQICKNGGVEIVLDEGKSRKVIGIEEIHIEEDAGKLLHDESFSGSLIDYNRCGVPLIEIVTKPDMRSAEEARAFLETIKSILQYLNISDCKMQEGSIRCDVNVSLREKGSDTYGTRCEMKNINTFSGAERAIRYEVQRQKEILEAGGTIEQETLRWDDAKGRNFPMRSKGDAADYRYFPEPDLYTVVVEPQLIERLKAEQPELPNAKTIRYLEDYQLPLTDINLFIENPDKADFFEACMGNGKLKPRTVSNWILVDITRILNEKNKTLADTNMNPDKLCRLISLVEEGKISSTAGRTVLDEIIFSEKEPEDVVKEKGLAQVSDKGALEAIAKDVLSKNEKAVNDYKNGKTNVLGFLVGQCMKASKGQGNPAILRELLSNLIETV